MTCISALHPLSEEMTRPINRSWKAHVECFSENYEKEIRENASTKDTHFKSLGAGLKT